MSELAKCVKTHLLKSELLIRNGKYSTGVDNKKLKTHLLKCVLLIRNQVVFRGA